MTQLVKNLPAMWKTWVLDLGSIPGLGRSPGGGHGNPLQYSCLEIPMDRGTRGGGWGVGGVGVGPLGRTQLKRFSVHTHALLNYS